jgi:hypothetical protein
MRVRRFIFAISLNFILLFNVVLSSAYQAQEISYGPEVKSFIELCRHEEEELEFQIKHHEITRQDYIRSKNRIAIQRQMVLKRAKDTGADIVPDLHVVTATEIDQLIEGGLKAVKGLKVGGVIADKWIYLGSVNRGEIYYIFEQTSGLMNVTRPRTVTRNQP